MIIIVEGVDGSGKSTLVKQLMKAGYKSTQIQSDRDDEYSEWCRLHHKSENDVIVTDRSFLTDLVYRMFDGTTRRGMDLFEISLILTEDVKVVFCESGTEFDDSIGRGEDNITRREDNEDIARIYKNVRNLIKSFTNCEIFVYNWHEMNVSDVIKFIEERR